MSQTLTIEAAPREGFGKNAARRLRFAGRLPAVIYGGESEAISVTVDPRQLASILRSEGGHTSLLNLEVRGGEQVRVMVKDWQTDPVRGSLLHVDFVRVTSNTRVRVKVPIHVTGEPQGVKLQGGIFEFVLREVEMECLPDDIPEHLTVDVSELTIGRNLRVSDLQAGPNVKVLTDPNRVVAHVVALKVEEEPIAAEGAEAAPAEPELIRKPKAEAEAGEEESKES
ncbi:MAG TPA: 50S ribosomal protein L25/general stress protein Ctc [Terriglobia bacterium]|nr:50S ribosomal protein L25/general stress protein Ctc [Terriglobia bacterium]